MDGRVAEAHCVEARSPTVRDARWVTVVVRVRGGREISHFMGGDPVLAYTDPVVGGGAVSGHDPARWRLPEPLSGSRAPDTPLPPNAERPGHREGDRAASCSGSVGA